MKDIQGNTLEVGDTIAQAMESAYMDVRQITSLDNGYVHSIRLGPYAKTSIRRPFQVVKLETYSYD